MQNKNKSRRSLLDFAFAEGIGEIDTEFLDPTKPSGISVITKFIVDVVF